MKLKSLVVLCSLGLLAAQAGANESVVTNAQTIDEQSGNTMTDQTVCPAMIRASAQTIDPETAAQADAIGERISNGKMSARQKAALSKINVADENKKNGDAFLADNMTKPGVVTLPSGVQYLTIHAGNGIKPADASLVVCNYRGTLIDGTEIDRSDANKPTSIYVSTFIPGLKEAVLLMPAGSKWEIVVPPQLAYRELGNRLVGPNATLIYEVELIGVK